MREDGLEHVAHLEAVLVSLIVVDVAPGERGLVEMPDERLFLERQRGESIGIQLHDRRVVDLFEQVSADWQSAPRWSTQACRRRTAARFRTPRLPTAVITSMILFISLSSAYRKRRSG